MTLTDSSATTAETFASWVDVLATTIASADPAKFAELFVDDGYWKDALAFTGGYRTYSGKGQIAQAWGKLAPSVQPRDVRVSGHHMAPRAVRRAGRNVIEGFADLTTQQGRTTVFVRLQVGEPGDRPRVWLMLTSLQELHGFEERRGANRPTGTQYSTQFAGDNWLDERRKQQAFEGVDPEVVIVGGGQGGLILAARLKQVGIEALVIEKNARVGDNWRHRYHSLTLHNQVWANSLPYMPFPDTWPTFVPKDKLAGWLECYAEAMELNVWTSTEMTSADFDESAEVWSIDLRTADGSSRTIRSGQLVMAVGGSTGVPNMPNLPGLNMFDGEVVHSSNFTSGVPYAGRHAVVIGTGTSGHDVAQDLYENGAASVTMVQRGPTCVVSLEPSGTMVYSLYSEGPPEDIDIITAAIPYDVLRSTYQHLTRRTCELDRDLLDGLRDVGFKLDFGHDDTGFHMMYLRHGGGYYINVGCSNLIIDRKIGLIQSDDIDRFDARGIVLTDGSHLPADLVVMATGYQNLKEAISSRLGPEVGERVGDIWGFDENHIMANMWQRTAQPNLWIMGGSLIDARLYSRYLTIQILADVRGIQLPNA